MLETPERNPEDDSGNPFRLRGSHVHLHVWSVGKRLADRGWVGTESCSATIADDNIHESLELQQRQAEEGNCEPTLLCLFTTSALTSRERFRQSCRTPSQTRSSRFVSSTARASRRPLK